MATYPSSSTHSHTPRPRRNQTPSCPPAPPQQQQRQKLQPNPTSAACSVVLTRRVAAGPLPLTHLLDCVRTTASGPHTARRRRAAYATIRTGRMRWADTDSEDSDDEFQTHPSRGSVVNTAMIDLSVSGCNFCLACTLAIVGAEALLALLHLCAVRLFSPHLSYAPGIDCFCHPCWPCLTHDVHSLDVHFFFCSVLTDHPFSLTRIYAAGCGASQRGERGTIRFQFIQ